MKNMKRKPDIAEQILQKMIRLEQHFLEPDDDPSVQIDEHGNMYGRWQFVIAYLYYLGNQKALEEFKQRLVAEHKATMAEIEKTLAFYVSCESL